MAVFVANSAVDFTDPDLLDIFDVTPTGSGSSIEFTNGSQTDTLEGTDLDSGDLSKGTITGWT
ncbi:MAG TPA: hypothetical protein VMT98_21205, partial [Verrucomicrobiae bacterium]|nr:hypothetical protein [Verrucomicrobiae bacterium]